MGQVRARESYGAVMGLSAGAVEDARWEEKTSGWAPNIRWLLRRSALDEGSRPRTLVILAKSGPGLTQIARNAVDEKNGNMYCDVQMTWEST